MLFLTDGTCESSGVKVEKKTVERGFCFQGKSSDTKPATQVDQEDVVPALFNTTQTILQKFKSPDNPKASATVKVEVLEVEDDFNSSVESKVSLVWDEVPKVASLDYDRASPWTPFTPADEVGNDNDSKKALYSQSPTVQRVLRGVSRFGQASQPAKLSTTPEKKHIKKDPEDPEDTFIPKKLFRNSTAHLEQFVETKADVLLSKEREKWAGNVDFSFSKISQAAVATSSTNPRTQASTKGFDAHLHVKSETKTESKQKASLKDGAVEVQSAYETSRTVEATFSSGKLEKILPLAFYHRIRTNNGRCIATILAGNQCSNNRKYDIGRLHVANLRRHRNNNQYFEVLDWIDDVVDSVLCTQHRKIAERQITELDLEDFVKGLSRSAKARESEEAFLFTIWVNALCNANSSTTITDEDSEVATSKKTYPTLSTEAETTQITTRKTRSNLTSGKSAASIYVSQKTNFTYAQTIHTKPFYAYSTVDGRNLSASQMLYKKLRSPLCKTEINLSGYIYIFWSKGVFGYVKIGRSKDPKERLKAWSNCDMAVEFHESSYKHELVQVPRVHLVERLIHIEMKDVRAKVDCERCGRPHDEWFKIRESHARKVFNKWKDWVLMDPYEPNADNNWRIKKTITDEEVWKWCEPLPVDDEPALSTRPKARKSASGSQHRKSLGIA